MTREEIKAIVDDFLGETKGPEKKETAPSNPSKKEKKIGDSWGDVFTSDFWADKGKDFDVTKIPEWLWNGGGRFLGDMKNLVTHPIQSVYGIGAGTLGALGNAAGIDSQFSEQGRALTDALIKPFTSPNNFAKELEENPIGLATIALPGVGLAGKGVSLGGRLAKYGGAAGAVGNALGKTGNAITKTASWIDPFSATTKAAQWAARNAPGIKGARNKAAYWLRDTDLYTNGLNDAQRAMVADTFLKEGLGRDEGSLNRLKGLIGESKKARDAEITSNFSGPVFNSTGEIDNVLDGLLKNNYKQGTGDISAALGSGRTKNKMTEVIEGTYNKKGQLVKNGVRQDAYANMIGRTAQELLDDLANTNRSFNKMKSGLKINENLPFETLGTEIYRDILREKLIKGAGMEKAAELNKNLADLMLVRDVLENSLRPAGVKDLIQTATGLGYAGMGALTASPRSTVTGLAKLAGLGTGPLSRAFYANKPISKGFSRRGEIARSLYFGNQSRDRKQLRRENRSRETDEKLNNLFAQWGV